MVKGASFLDSVYEIEYFCLVMKPDIQPAKAAAAPFGEAAAKAPIKSLDIFGNENKSLISLAVKCRMITIDEEAQLLDQLAHKRQKDPDYSALDLFQATRVLSEEDISFLLAVRDHLELKMLDKKFGELGIANQFIQPESLKKALDIQNTIFKETNESKLIGDILLENNEITPSDKAAILLTQDRIKDELLYEAMNDIAASEIEKLSLNMRFGAIAVKKEFISIAQLNQALAIQGKEVRQGSPRRYMGDILKELFDLPDDVLNRILKIQKELEKKRLALEKALEKYNSEANINKRIARAFDYRFSKNKLEAFLGRSRETYEDIRVSDLKRWLNSIGITFGFCEDKALHDFLAENIVGHEICIAKGIPPAPGEDGRIEFYFDTDSRTAENEADLDLLPLVKKGDAMAQRIPAVPGKPGKDVSGFALAPPVPKQAALNCGEGVIRDEDLFIADTDGIAVLVQNRTLFVKAKEIRIPTRHHTGTIDADLGETYQGVNLKVDGDILESGMVRCQGLEVLGSIYGQVRATGDIIVRGAIGRFPVEGQQDAEPAKIKAEGDIIASKSITNAIVVTGKSLVAPNADLSATAVQAFQDVTVKNILYSQPRPCVIQTGKAPSLKADSINALIKARTAKLGELACSRELGELEDWLREKMELKESFLSQQGFLKFIMALIRFQPLSGLSSLSDKLLAAQKHPDKWPELPPLPGNGFTEFMQEFIKETKDMDTDTLEAHTQEQADLKYGMYRAAVNATRRYNMEYETRKKLIQEKVAGRQAEIEKLEDAIDKLTIRRDTFLLSQAYKSPPVPPAIRVKNRVARATIIKGQAAKLAVTQDIYGVKFTETPKTSAEPAQILIEGFYD